MFTTSWPSSSIPGRSGTCAYQSAPGRYQAGLSMLFSYGQQEGGHRVMAAAGKLGVRYRALAVSAEGVSRWVPDPRLAAAADRDGGRDAVARGKGSGHRKKEENLQRMRDRRSRCWAVRSAGLAKP